MAVDTSDFESKLLKSSSLVSAPVFLIFGEPSKADVPSLKEDVALILSAYVENLRVKVAGESRLVCPMIPFVLRGIEMEVEKCSGCPKELS